MASIADLLGVQWQGSEGGQYRLNAHATRQTREKGFHPDHVLQAANDPHHTYPNGRYPGQARHVRNGIVAVVDPHRKEVITVYKDQEKTALRPDQTDPDAQRYGKSEPVTLHMENSEGWPKCGINSLDPRMVSGRHGLVGDAARVNCPRCVGGAR